MTISNLHASAGPSTFLQPWTDPGEHVADHSTQRAKREAPLPGHPDARTRADAELANSFADGLLDETWKTDYRIPTIRVPPESTLGRWRTLLDSAFKEPGFLEWARQLGLNTNGLTIIPSRGTISGFVDGRLKTFSLSDDSGWSDVSRSLLSISRVFAPKPRQDLHYPWPGADEMRMETVAQFYGEPVFPGREQAAARAKELKEHPQFKLADDYAPARSDTALEAHKQALGDDANRHALISALKSQVDDADGRIDPENVKVPIDPRSTLFGSEKKSEMSVAQRLRLEGITVPVNREQALGLALALSFDLAHRAPGVESGGVKPLTGVLGATSLRKMKKYVEEWKAQHVPPASGPAAGVNANSLLNRLIGSLPEATKKAIADNPSLALDQLVRSPAAKDLGKGIQKKLGLLDTPTIAIESVSAALVQELDPGAGTSRFNLAGYNLYGADNAGFPAAEIVKRFTTHLAGQVGVEAAPLAARLLLSAAAPELLVKDIPPNLVYGSHTWANFCIEVSRIEQQVPGASANMTFSQIMAFGNAPLVFQEDEDQLSVAVRDPIIVWGVANGVIKSSASHLYTDAEFERSREALNKQQKELAWAKQTLSTPPLTRRALALAELKRVFPGVDPTLKVLQAPWVKHDSVSLLDVYMTGPIVPDSWMSVDTKAFPYDEMKSRLSQLDPDIKKTFSTTFEAYRRDQATALAIQFKYQLSLLPMTERERIAQSQVSFFEVSRPYLKTGPCTSGLFTEKVCLPPDPTPQELEALKGRKGLFMKVVGSNGEVSTYSYFPAEGKLVKENGFPASGIELDDRPYFGEHAQGYIPGLPHVYTPYGEPQEKTKTPEAAANKQGTYFSERNGALGGIAGNFFAQNYDALKHEAEGVTELEKGKAYDEKLKGFLLSLVPFYDGVDDIRQGNVGGAILNIGFDILGFILPGISAGRKASKAGKGIFNVIKSGVFAGVGASVGYTDSAHITKNLNKGVRAGYKDFNYVLESGQAILSRLKGNYGHYDVTKVYKDGDIVKGFFLSAEDHLWRPTVAIFKKGAWYTYNVVTKTPFGPQAAQFGVVSALET